jgi:hypothetical protein
MIVELSVTTDGGLRALQRQMIPSVYLDLCAMRAIAERTDWSARFVEAMRRARASLLIGAITIYEFATFSDVRHARAVDSLLQELFRHLYFINCEPFTVIARENAQIAGAPNTAPHADAELFRQTMILVHQQTGPFELTAIFSGNSAELRPVIQDFRTNVRRAFEILQTRVESEPEIRRNANNALANIGHRQASTAALFTALIKPLHDDRLPSENDTIDLLHAVVPGAYAEFVVLDGKWASAMAQAAQRIRVAGYTAPIARAFSPRDNGIVDFLSALEAWPDSEPSEIEHGL